MNKCADCQFWYNIEHTDMGACRHLFAYKQNDYAPIQIVLRCEDRPVNTETHKHFGCVHFGEKQCGPFHIQRKIGSDLRIGWRMLFNDEIIWAPDLEISQVHRWVKLLNDLWIQKEEKQQDCGPFKVHDSCDGRQKLHFGCASVVKEIHVAVSRIELERIRDWLNELWAQ